MAKTDARIAIITGASRSIGPEVGQRLAKDGFSVVINYSNDAASAEKRAREIEAAGGRALPVKADLFLKGRSNDLIDQFAELTPLERSGPPRDIANDVACLAGPDGGWINGQALGANGGVI
jgi:NAD(P)-dependent dehydrogenase (short-subunit alcohol dehydrogenase family)